MSSKKYVNKLYVPMLNFSEGFNPGHGPTNYKKWRKATEPYSVGILFTFTDSNISNNSIVQKQVHSIRSFFFLEEFCGVFF